MRERETQAFIKANSRTSALLPSKDHARTGVCVQAGCRVSARMLQEHPRVERGAPLADRRRINENTGRGNAACGRRVDEPRPQRSQEDLDERCVRSGRSVVPKRRRAQMATLCVCSTRPGQLRARAGVRKHDQTRGARSGLPCAGGVHQKLEVLEAGFCPLRRVVRGNAIDAHVRAAAHASAAAPHPVDATLKLEQAWSPGLEPLRWSPCGRVRRVRRDRPVQRRHGEGVHDQELLEQRVSCHSRGARLRWHDGAQPVRMGLHDAAGHQTSHHPPTPARLKKR